MIPFIINKKWLCLHFLPLGSLEGGSGPIYFMTSVSVTQKLKKVIQLNCYNQRSRRENRNHGTWARFLETAGWLDVNKYNIP